MTHQTKKITSLIIIFAAAFLVCSPVLAADKPPIPAGPNLGLEYGQYTGLAAKDIRGTVASIINIALSFLGIVAVVIVLIGGFIWMTSMGNDEKVTQAKKLLTAGVIGMIIILCAYIIANFVALEIIKATSEG